MAATATEAPIRTRHCQAAQAYLSRGWRPIAVEANGKRPLAKNWPALRLTLAEAADTWDTEAPPNIGLLCGDASRLVILDFDTPAAFDAWAEAHPEAAQTRTVARDNAEPGRQHLYFALTEGQAAPASAKAPGWDLLSDGRQAVAPPSRHPSGGTYKVVRNVAPLPWRDEYRPEAARAETPQPCGVTGEGHPLAWDATIGGTPDTTPAYARAALASEAAAVATAVDGGRNDRLNVAALKCGQLVAAGLLTVPEVESTLQAAARQCGLADREAAATVASGLRKGTTEPRAVPPPFPKRDGGRVVLTTPEPPLQALDPWTPPAPLTGAAAGLSPWPWAALPAVLADMGQAVAAAVGVHESMAGAAVLGCAGIALGNRVALQIKDGHGCRGNLYWLVAAPVGTGKTPALRPCLTPLQAWEAEQKPEYLRALGRWKFAEAVTEARRKNLTRDATKADADPRHIEHERDALEAELGPEPTEPRLYVEDSTSEALGRRLVGNAERMGVVSSEGRKVLAIAKGRYVENGGDLDLWLKGHAGDPHRVDRQNRPPYDLRKPCLSALLFVQPDALQTIGQDPEARASGFLARFLYLCPPGGAAVEYPRGTVPEATATAYSRMVRALLTLPACTAPDGAPAPLPATLHPEAFELFTDLYRGWGAELNEAAATGNAFLAEWLGKLREHAARLALLFAATEAASDGAGWTGPLCVTLEHLGNAARVCEHLKEHARRAAGVIGESQELADARRVWGWIAGNRGRLAELRQAEGCGAVAAVKARDLLRAGLPGCDSAEAAGKVLRALESRGYLQSVLWQRPGAGAKAHELWYTHPATTEGAGHGR
jgi:hypothetical protein